MAVGDPHDLPSAVGRPHGLTNTELHVCSQLADALDTFDHCSGSDVDRAEFAAHIHAAQTIVMARAAQRSHPSIFVAVGNTPEHGLVRGHS